MEKKNSTQNYFKVLFNIAVGAGAVIGSAYVLSRLKDKQNTDTRLERMEQILEEINEGITKK